jgi:putative transposase
VYGPDTAGWADVDALEHATLSWVHWFNHDRLHGHCNDIPPAEFEANWAHAQASGNGGADQLVPVAGS